MIAGGENGFAPMSALWFVLPKDDTVSSLIRLLVFVVVIVGPAIFKSIRESARKKKALAEKSSGRLPMAQPDLEEQEEDEADPEPEVLEQPGGREQWERLLRGESAVPPPIVPPPLPVSTGLERALGRRVLTDTPALTDAAPLTDNESLTDARPVIVATPGKSMLDPTGYDGVNQPKLGLGRNFAGFEPQEGLASDRAGGPAKRVGDRATFTGGDDFQSLTATGAQSEVTRREIGGHAFAVTDAPLRLAGRRITRRELRRTLQLAEILGPPVGVRPLESGPTRPLGWS